MGIPVAAVVSGLAAWLLGSLVLTMRGHYFAICTLRLGIAAGQVAAGIPWLGAGSGMLTPNPPVEFADLGRLLYYLALGLAILCALTFAWLLSTRFGLALNAIRDDEDQADAMGVRTHAAKVTAWVAAACFRRGWCDLQSRALHRSHSDRLRRRHHRRMDDRDGAAWRQGHAPWAHHRRHRVQVTKELFWTYLLGLAAGGAWTPDRAGRRVLPRRPVGFMRERGSQRRGRGGRMTAMLALNGVTKAFGGVVANDGISIAVPEGAIVGLIGPNGSGKTTLFNAITGTHAIDPVRSASRTTRSRGS
ncbi:MAG: ATP-binding cassette domain-containing protein [Hyphomicrobiales bacterium]